MHLKVCQLSRNGWMSLTCYGMEALMNVFNCTHLKMPHSKQVQLRKKNECEM